MKRFTSLFAIALVCALIVATGVSALVVNGNFETGTFGSWTKSSYINNGFSSPLGAGGADLSSIVGGPLVAPLSQSDPRSNNQIQFPAYGHYSAKVNNETSYTTGGHGQNGNMITQNVVAYIDPADSLSHTKFAYSAVMANPASGHTDDQKPYFRVRAINVSNGSDVLYDFESYVNEPGKNWQDGAIFSGSEAWQYLNWQVIDLTSSPLHPVNAGDNVRIEVSASGCSLGGHPGYVYVDEITDNEIAGPTVRATGPATIGQGSTITYTYTYKNGSASAIDETVTATQPTGVTFTSVADPNCNLSGGAVTCNFANVASGDSGTFTVDGTVTASTGFQIAHGEYSVASPGFPTVGGQTVLTDVTSVATTTSVASSVNPSRRGQNVTFTATVTQASGSAIPTGNVQFSIDGTNVGSPVALNASGTATYSTSALAVGNHPVAVSYAGAPGFNASNGSLTGGQTVNKADSATAVATSPNPSDSGQTVTLTATVTAVLPGVGTPAGTIQFSVDGVNLGSPVALNGSGVAQITTSSMSVGTRNVGAAYSGNANFNPSSNTSPHQVDLADTTTSVASSLPTSTYGQNVTFTATVAVVAPGVGTPGGTVSFFDGATPIPGCQNLPLNGSGQAQCSAANLTGGGHTINVTYSGNASFNGGSGSTPQTVSKANLGVTASSHTVTYGDAAPAVSPSYAGFVLGQGPADLSTQPTCSTTYAEGSSATGSPYSTSCAGGVSGNYNFVPTSGTVTVNKATLAVTASSHNVTYGDAAPGITPSYSGFVLSQGPGNLTTAPSCSTAYSQGSSAAGSPYTSSCSGGVSNNYSFSYTGGTVNVDKAVLAVTASSPTVTFGDAVPSITPGYSGFVLSQGPASLTTAPTCSTTYTQGSSAAGSPYTTSCGGGVSNDYSFSYTDGAVSVNKATLTVTASSPTVTFGDAAPAITPSYSGFVLSQGPASLATAPTCSTAYTQGASAAGSPYATSCGGGVSNDYAFAYTNGTVSVNKAVLSVTASSHTVTFGDAVPNVTPAYSGFVLSQGPANLATVPTCSTAYTQGVSAAGSPYATSCSGGVSNDYAFSYTGGTVAVNKAVLTVTASSHTVTFGDAAPTISPAYSGFVLSQGPANLTTAPSCSTVYAAGSTAANSPYVSSCTGGVSNDYSFSYVNGTVAVNKATLTVTASSHTVNYGAAPPTVTPSYAGFVLGQTAASLTTVPSCTTTYIYGTGVADPQTSTSCAGGVSPNYAFVYVNGTVTVTKTNTTTGVAILINPPVYGQTLTATATMTAVAPGGGTPQGTVNFFDGGSPIAGCQNVVVNSLGAAVCSSNTLAAGVNKSISAQYSGNSNYNPSSGSTNQTINKAPLTVVASSHTVTYGDAVPAVTPTITGFALGQSVADITAPSCSTTYTQGSPVSGSQYPTTCSGAASANYTFNYTAGTVTVNKRGLTVTADNKTRSYGAANPALTATFSGFVSGQNVGNSDVTGSPLLTTSATATSTVNGGPYPISITAGTLNSSNYSFTFVNGQLTVDKATLTVTANNATRVYGTANPAFSARYSGFVNGEGNSSFTGAPSLTTTAVVASPVGPYDIVAGSGTLSAANYNFAFVNGTLSVNKAPTITTITNAAAIATGTSRVGQGFAVNWTTVPESPATGTLSGNVIVSDGNGATCTAPVAVGTCSLVSTTPGIKAVVATYQGDNNFLSSNSIGTFHSVVIVIAGNVKMQGTQINVAGVTVRITGSAAGETITDATGNYSFNLTVAGGNYTVTPSGLGYTYAPENRNYTSVADNVLDADFVAVGGPVILPTPTPNATPTPNVTPTPNATPTPAVTPTPGITPTPNPSPTPTASPSPTPTGMGGEGDVVDASGATLGGDGVHGDDLAAVREFALKNSQADINGMQFQRGDTAPRDPSLGIFGDGAIDSSDVTIVRLYSMGLLPDTSAAGPIVPDVAPTPPVMPDDPRVIRVINVATRPGETVTVQFEMAAEGDEASESFTFRYDRSVLSNPVVSVGNGVSQGTHLGTNMKDLGDGRIGVLLDSVTAHAPGARQILSVRFNVAANAQIGLYPVTFEDSTTVRSVSSTVGRLLPTRYQTGYVQIGSTAAGVSVSGRVTTAAGQGLRNATVVITDQQGNRRTTTTGSFGMYRFDDIESGKIYIVGVTSKRYRFNTRMINLTDSVNDADFIGNE
ncbi:MAG: MBG domain-containing protein [Pyrinomonadaceae bacterium]